MADPVAYRGAILPYLKRKSGATEWALPGLLYAPLKGAESVGGMLLGQRPVDPRKVTETMVDTAMLSAPVGLLGGVPKGAVLGANVWQGGPHKYGPEGASQSLKHIGKGEGAQAYGWGRYDAGAEQVGKEYRDQLTDLNVYAAERALKKHGGDYDAAIKAAEDKIKNLQDNKKARDSNPRRWAAQIQINEDKIAQLNQHRRTGDFDKGYLYKHDLPDEDIARYLDWDAPLSDQPESVQVALGIKRDKARDNEIISRLKELDAEIKSRSKTDGDDFDALFSGEIKENEAIGRLVQERSALEAEINNESVLPILGRVDPSKVTGRWLYEEMMNQRGALDWPLDATAAQRAAARGGSKQAASEALGRAGIPGLKYYDGMSRGKGEGTRNYVTWDQDVLDRMKLLERNGETFAPSVGLLGKKVKWSKK